MHDNRSGNFLDEIPAEAYCSIYPELRTLYNKGIKNSTLIDEKSPTALWILQLAQQVKSHSSKRVFFMDNFYTHHTLASVLKHVTDDKARVIGTIKFTNVDGTNRKFLKIAIERLKDAPRGRWMLVRAYDRVDDLKKL